MWDHGQRLGILERADELGALELALTDAVAGRGRLVILYGVAGIGRSCLVRASTEMATTVGAQVLTARGSELERGYAFSVARQLLEGCTLATEPSEHGRTLEAALAAHDLEHSQGRADGRGSDQLEVLQSFARRVAEEQPLLIAVDDVQWCDRPSLDLLCYLGHRATRLPMVVLLAWRRGEPGVRAGGLQALAADRDTIWLAPAPLSARSVQKLIARESGVEADRAVVEVVHRRTGGMPFLVEEMARAIRADRLLPGDAAGAISAITPDPVLRDVAVRLGRHSEAARRIACAVAVVEGACSIAQAAEVAEVELGPATRAADALVRGGFLIHDGSLSFRFPVIRDATYDTFSSVELAQLHTRTAELILRAGGDVDAERVARHLLLGLPRTGRRFGPILRSAADAAAGRGDDRLARRCLRRALEEPDEPDERRDTLAALGEAELRLGELRGAAQHLAAARTIGDDACDRDDHALGAQAALALMQLCEHRAPSELAEAPLGPSLAATGSGRALLAARCAAAVLHGRASAGQIAAGWRAVLESDGRAAADPGAVAVYVVSRAALLADHHERAERAISWLDVHARIAAVTLRSQLHLARGELARADADAVTSLGAIDRAERDPLPSLLRSDALTVRALVALHQGRQRHALEALGELCSAATDGDRHPACVALRIMIELRLGPGPADLAEAPAIPEGILAPGLCWRPTLAAAYQRAGDEAMAARLTQAHLSAARRWRVDSALGDALLARAASCSGEARRELIEHAVQVFEKTAATVGLARARIELGSALRRERRRIEAREKLVSGIDLADRCGAFALADSGRAELAAAGARPRRQAFSGLDSLTLSERRVAELAASELTNRQIAQTLTVSMKTVAGQLNAVYHKLDVHDRRALALALAGGRRDEGSDGK